MNITDKNIDGGKAFDWGKVSADYARFRDIYPAEFYDKMISRNLCISGQRVLDVGTGTGVLPRNMYRYRAKWTGTDLSENQIKQARALSAGMNIDYYVLPTENLHFPDGSFDIITVCQCFWYFNHEQAVSKFYHMLGSDGRILVLYMAWLPYEDKIAAASEKLVLKYNPNPDKPEKFFTFPPRFKYNKEKRWRICPCYLRINTLTRFMVRSLVMTA